MQTDLQNSVKIYDSAEQFSALLLTNLVIDESEEELLLGLSELIEFKKLVNYKPFKALSDEYYRENYLTHDDKIRNKLYRKKNGWEEYNTELSYLNRIFTNADKSCDRFNFIRRRQDIESFKDKSPTTLSTLYFMEIAGVADYMLYLLITNPKNYFSAIKI
jgi:hypothetical protein